MGTHVTAVGCGRREEQVDLQYGEDCDAGQRQDDAGHPPRSGISHDSVGAAGQLQHLGE